MANDISLHRKLAQVRAKQLADEDEILRRWLVRVRLFGWPLLILSLVFPVAAGSLALLDDKYKALVAFLSFAGAAAIAVHGGLHCETYQQALKRTIQTIRSIIEDYESVAALSDAEVVAAFKRTEARLQELRANSTDLPPKRLRKFEEMFANGAESGS